MHVKEIAARYRSAESVRAQWTGLFDDAYRHLFPNRPGFNQMYGQGADHAAELYDGTAVDATSDLAARLQAWAAPIEGRWMELAAGQPGHEARREAAALTELVFDVLRRSRLDVHLYEAMLDFVVSTGALRLEDGGPLQPMRAQAVPLSRLYIEPGPYDDYAALHVRWEMSAAAILRQWPDAALPPDVAGETLFTVVESTVRDYGDLGTEAWDHMAYMLEPATPLETKRFTGAGSSPWIVFRWSKCPGEAYGRGPGLTVLPDARAANLLVQYVLENAEFAIAGMYNADDDGVVNPTTIRITPGAIIPRAVGSTGLEPIQSASRFDVSALAIEDLRASIRRTLFTDTAHPQDARTPPSATQVMQHETEKMSRLSPAIARFTSEFYEAVMARVLYLLARRGMIERAPSIALGEVSVKATSPLSTFKGLEVLQRTQNWLDIVGSRSPEAMGLTMDLERFADYAAAVLGVPTGLMRTRAERQEHVQNAVAILQQAAQTEQTA